MVLGLACMFMPSFNWYPAFEDIERGTAAASFIRTMSGVFVASGYVLIRFIFSSSSAIYGEGKKPKSPYGLHKLISEMECDLYQDLFDIKCVCLRK